MLRKLALFDIDKTIYDGYIIFPLADYQFEKKIIDKKCYESLYTDLELYKDTKVNYESTVDNLNLHWATGLTNKPYKNIFELTEYFLSSAHGNKFYPFTSKLISLLKSEYDIYFVTGELQFIGKVVSDIFSAAGFISSELEIVNGMITGKIKKSLAKREEKSKAIRLLMKTHKFDNSLGFGDSEGDIEMLNSVQFPICINPTEGLRQISIHKKWPIVNSKNIIKIVSRKLQIKDS